MANKNTPERTPPVTPIDMRKYTRDAKTTETNISIVMDYQQWPWIKAGTCQLSSRKSDHRPVWDFGARLLNATDFEHDSAYAFKIALIGVEFEMLHGGTFWFHGWIDAADPTDFCMYPPGVDPYADAAPCKARECKTSPHRIVERFAPPSASLIKESGRLPGDVATQQLWERVRGQLIKIVITRGPATED